MAAPVLQALLLADQIYQDLNTGKYVICGIFSVLNFVLPESASGGERSSGSDVGERGSGGGSGSGGAGTDAGGGTRADDDSSHDEKAEDEDDSLASPPQTSIPITRLVRAGSPYAYISLTELQGTRKFELRYVDLEENTVLFATGFEVSCRDPLETIQITAPLPPLPAPHEGVFVLELLCDGEMLGSHRVLAKSQPKS